MSDAPETLAAILREMRREAGAQTNPSPLDRYADRIEAAAEHLRDATKMVCDTPAPLAALLAEMRDLSENRDWHNHTAQSNRERVSNLADRIEAAVQRFVADNCAKCAHYHAATISLKDALELANTIANHGITTNDLGDKASATIYALCHEVRTVRGEDANIKQESQKLRRELRDLRRAPGNAAAMREALEYVCHMDDEGYTSYDVHVAMQKARAALAAPARNCDRFAVPGKAWRAYKAECDKDETVPNMIGAISWLLDTAEGGAE